MPWLGSLCPSVLDRAALELLKVREAQSAEAWTGERIAELWRWHCAPRTEQPTNRRRADQARRYQPAGPAGTTRQRFTR